jgi:hypothetical protein
LIKQAHLHTHVAAPYAPREAKLEAIPEQGQSEVLQNPSLPM